MTDRSWVADPAIGWRILLTARLDAPPEPTAVGTALRALAEEQGWTAGPPVTERDLGTLRAALVRPHPEPVRVGLAGPDLVVAAHHAAVDGLGLLRVLAALTGEPVASDARGAGDRAAGAPLGATVRRRIVEAALRPPASVAPPLRARGRAGDVLVDAEVAGSLRTADLVWAAARAVVDRRAEQGRTTRHVAIAVGVGGPADGAAIADRSGLLRLRDVERLDRDAVREAIRTAPLETPPGTAGGSPVIDRLTAVGLRLLAPRLGSSILVSHLGEVSAAHVDRLVFHPVTAGGSGISLGAVGHRGRTTVSLRARAARWDEDGLERLLEAVLDRLRR
ncbi:MAG TPA: hypothetical protein VNS55_14540 [Nocardioides sp.]|nr:hypothetical protein [Nocardioides sp.]